MFLLLDRSLAPLIQQNILQIQVSGLSADVSDCWAKSLTHYFAQAVKHIERYQNVNPSHMPDNYQFVFWAHKTDVI